jgi:flagellin
MITVNTNPTSLLTQSNLNQTSNQLTTAVNRLSSGYRVNSAADDPAGIAVAAPLQSQIKGLYQANQNALESTNITTVADNTLSVVQDNLTRIQQVATQSANGVYTKQQRQNLQGEVDQLTQEISRMVKNTNYNSFPLFSSKKEQFTFQIGANGDGTRNKAPGKKADKALKMSGRRPPSIKKLTGEGLRKAAPKPAKNAGNSITFTLSTLASKGKGGAKTGLVSKTVGLATKALQFTEKQTLGYIPIIGKKVKANIANKQANTGLTAYSKDLSKTKVMNVTTQSGARLVLQNVQKDINTVTKDRAQVGAITNRLGYVQRTNDALTRGYQSSVSNIMDADYAAESSNYAAAQIKQQAGAAVLAQANAMPQIALTLLR